MALTVTHASAQLFSVTKTLPLAANDGTGKTAYVFVTSKGSAQSSNVLGAMTGWTSVIDLGTGNAGNGNDPRMWCYKKAVPDGTSDFTLSHADNDGSWVLIIVQGDLGTEATATEFGYGTSMDLTRPGTATEEGILLGGLGTNALTIVYNPTTGVKPSADGYSDCNGSYRIETHPGGTSPAWTTNGATNYTLGWVWVPEDTGPAAITPVEGATVDTGIAVTEGMVVETGEALRTTTWTFANSPDTLDVSATLETVGNLPVTEAGEVYAKVVDGSSSASGRAWLFSDCYKYSDDSGADSVAAMVDALWQPGDIVVMAGDCVQEDPPTQAKYTALIAAVFTVLGVDPTDRSEVLAVPGNHDYERAYFKTAFGFTGDLWSSHTIGGARWLLLDSMDASVDQYNPGVEAAQLTWLDTQLATPFAGPTYAVMHHPRKSSYTQTSPDSYNNNVVLDPLYRRLYVDGKIDYVVHGHVPFFEITKKMDQDWYVRSNGFRQIGTGTGGWSHATSSSSSSSYMNAADGSGPAIIGQVFSNGAGGSYGATLLEWTGTTSTITYYSTDQVARFSLSNDPLNNPNPGGGTIVAAEQKLADIVGGEPAQTGPGTFDLSANSSTDYDVVYRVKRELASIVRPPGGVGSGSSGPIIKGNIPTADYWPLLGMDAKVGATEKWVKYDTGSDGNAGTEGAPWKTLSYALGQLNGSTGTIWLNGYHPDIGELHNIKGQSRTQLIAVRGLAGTNPRIHSTNQGAAVGFKDTYGNIVFYGIDFLHLTYRAEAQNWGGNRSTFALLFQGDQAQPGGTALDYALNVGVVYILNCAAEGFGHGFGGLGVGAHIIAGNYAIDNAYWCTGGGSGISTTRLGGAQYNNWSGWNYSTSTWTNGLGWDLAPIYYAPDGTGYQYVQMGNVSYTNRQKIVSYGIGLDYQSDANGIIFGDSEYSKGKALQTLNVCFRNGSQGVNAFQPPSDGVDQYFNTAWHNGYHREDGLNLGNYPWYNEVISQEYTSTPMRTSVVGNLTHSIANRATAGVLVYQDFNPVFCTQNYSAVRGGAYQAAAGTTLISDIGIVSRTESITDSDPNLTAGSLARGKVSASHRRAAWDFNGATVPTSGMLDAGALQYAN